MSIQNNLTIHFIGVFHAMRNFLVDFKVTLNLFY